jgi:hypothetical protein
MYSAADPGFHEVVRPSAGGGHGEHGSISTGTAVGLMPPFKVKSSSSAHP